MAKSLLSVAIACVAILFVGAFAHAGSKGSGGSVSVRGYFKKDGTYVQPHMRSAPDGNFSNNWSTTGNINPYTGEEGKKDSPTSSGARLNYSPSLYPMPAPATYRPSLIPSPSNEPAATVVPDPTPTRLVAPSNDSPGISGRETVSSKSRPIGRSMSTAELQSLELACVLAKSDGPSTYNKCLAEQRASFARMPSRPDLTGLSSEDRQSLELACILAKSDGPSTYVKCQHRQVQMLSSAPARPNVNHLTHAERQSLDLACILAKSDGPAALNRCLALQMKQLEAGLRTPSLASLTSAERQSIEVACILAKSDGPASYNSCLHGQLAKLNQK